MRYLEYTSAVRSIGINRYRGKIEDGRMEEETVGMDGIGGMEGTIWITYRGTRPDTTTKIISIISCLDCLSYSSKANNTKHERDIQTQAMQRDP